LLRGCHLRGKDSTAPLRDWRGERVTIAWIQRCGSNTVTVQKREKAENYGDQSEKMVSLGFKKFSQQPFKKFGETGPRAFAVTRGKEQAVRTGRGSKKTLWGIKKVRGLEIHVKQKKKRRIVGKI